MTENDIAREIVDAAFRIHTALGPGLLESVYQTVLVYELGRRGLRTQSEQPIPLVYENVTGRSCRRGQSHRGDQIC